MGAFDRVPHEDLALAGPGCSGGAMDDVDDMDDMESLFGSFNGDEAGRAADGAPCALPLPLPLSPPVVPLAADPLVATADAGAEQAGQSSAGSGSRYFCNVSATTLLPEQLKDPGAPTGVAAVAAVTAVGDDAGPVGRGGEAPSGSAPLCAAAGRGPSGLGLGPDLGNAGGASENVFGDVFGDAFGDVFGDVFGANFGAAFGTDVEADFDFSPGQGLGFGFDGDAELGLASALGLGPGLWPGPAADGTDACREDAAACPPLRTAVDTRSRATGPRVGSPATASATAPGAVLPASLTASIPHYRELRPRCPQGPPPPRIDLGTFDMEQLLPYVQLHSKLSLKGIKDLLGLDADAGKCVVDACRHQLARPAQAAGLSGTCDPAALRVLKLTLIGRALALLKDGEGCGGVGARWFGRDACLAPKSVHVWPDDSTTLTLLFIQLLYRLMRNKSTRDRYQKTAAGRARRRSATPSAPEEALPAPAVPLTAPRPPVRPVLSYSSPRVLREALALSPTAAATPCGLSPAASALMAQRAQSTARWAQAQSPGTASLGSSGSSGSSHSSGSSASWASSASSVSARLVRYARPPADAAIRYLVNVVDGSAQRVIPQLVLGHEGPIRDRGYTHCVGACARLGQGVAAVSVVTLLGLEPVGDDAAWDRAVCRVYDEMVMDGEVRVLVCVR